MHFFTRELDGLLEAAREKLGGFVGCDGDDLIFVDNATMGMNIVAEGVPLSPGDEVLLSDHEYGAVRRIWERRCARSDAKLVEFSIPCPIASSDEVLAALEKEIGPRSRVLVVSHVTSPTAIVFPLWAMIQVARARGLTTVVDGPHAIAMIPLSIRELDCDFYAASCHKWLSAPFGSGFLFAHPRARKDLRPLVMSWGRRPDGGPASWRDEFTWAGTRDPSAFLAIGEAIDFLERFGLPEFRERTHRLSRLARARIGELTGLPPLAPNSPEWYGSMVTLPLPPGDAPGLQRDLWERNRVEIPVIDWRGGRYIRPSCHLYTTEEEIETLARALADLL